jgi:hypothetical protein
MGNFGYEWSISYTLDNINTGDKCSLDNKKDCMKEWNWRDCGIANKKKYDYNKCLRCQEEMQFDKIVELKVCEIGE